MPIPPALRSCSLMLASVAACAPGQAQSVWRDGGNVHLVGRLDSAAATDFSRLNFDGVTVVEVNSRGGKIDAALAIADLIRKHRLRVKIDHECMSACASIILPASHAIEIGPSAVIALHDTQYGLYSLFERSRSQDNHALEQSPVVKQLAEAELELLRSANVSTELLALPYVSRGKSCYAAITQRDGSIQFSVGSERPAVIVNPATLAEFGLKVDPSTFRTPESMKVHATPAEVRGKFASLRLAPCPAEIVAQAGR